MFVFGACARRWAISKHQIIASDGDDVALDAAAFDVDVSLFGNLGRNSGPEELEAALEFLHRGIS